MGFTYSEGSVFKGRGRWRGKLIRTALDGSKSVITRTLLDDAGMPIPCKENSNANVKTAKAALARWRAELMANNLETETEAEAVPSATTMTVYEYVSSHIEALAAAYDPETQTGGIQPSTANTYRYIADHIREGFKGVALADLTTKAVEMWVADLRAQGLKPATVTKAYNLLKMTCQHAVDCEELSRNPCTQTLTKSMRLYRGASKKPNALDETSYSRLNTALDLIGHTVLADAARVALHTGMRAGEVCGLRWMDVDLAHNEIIVRNAIGRDRGATYTKPPKSGKQRRIPMDGEVRAVLEERKRSMALECAEMEVAFSSRLYAFGTITAPEQAANSYQSPNALSKQWNHLAKALDLKGINGDRPTFHDLRHTFATHAIHEGVDAETVAAIMGHSSTRMTLDVYGDALPEAKREAMERMGEVMGRRSDKALVLELRPTGTDEGR